MAIQVPYRTDRLAVEQSLLGVHLPASMPQTIARSMITPSIAVSQWPQHTSQFAVSHSIDIPYHWTDPPPNDMPIATPSNSFQSTTLSGVPWSEPQELQHLSWHEGDLDPSLLTAHSSFEFAPHHLSNPTSFSLPPVADAPLHPQDLDCIGDTHQVDQVFARRSLTTTPRPGANMSTLSRWAQGTYNVSDRTNFGTLAGQSIPPPGPKRRKTTQSHAGSSTSMSCEECGKSFNSKADKE